MITVEKQGNVYKAVYDSVYDKKSGKITLGEPCKLPELRATLAAMDATAGQAKCVNPFASKYVKPTLATRPRPLPTNPFADTNKNASGVEPEAGIANHGALSRNAIRRLPNDSSIVQETDFRRQLTVFDLHEIRGSKFVVFDLETTGLTRYAKPTPVGASAKIGSRTLTRYKADTGSTVNNRVRARVVSIQLSAGQKIAFDLDALTKTESGELMHACLHNQVVIGWNLGFDYAFALGYCADFQPKMTIDVMLLVRCHWPADVWAIHQRACDEKNVDAREICKKKEGSASLEAISTAYGLGRPDKSFQHARNWCVSNLSRDHFDYVMGDISHPLSILEKMYGSHDIDSIIAGIRSEDAKKGFEYLDIFEKAPLELARIHERGMPVKIGILNNIDGHRSGLIPKLVDEAIKQIPAFESHRDRLMSVQPGVSAELKQILADYCKSCGCELEVGADGNAVIQAKSAKLKGATELEGWKAWESLQHAKKTLASVSEYKNCAVMDPRFEGWSRVHPLISCTTATLRTASKMPNSQNMERYSKKLAPDLNFRTSIHARPGYKIISADYGQIELRIAAALSLRCIEEIHRAINGKLKVPDWILSAIKSKVRPDFELAAEFWETWQKVQARGATMAQTFRRGVDPHLLTGLKMAVRQGVVDIGDKSAIDYILCADTEELKARISVQRDAAKALNFGLLYGMSTYTLWVQGVVTYGLKWTIEEAEIARTAWFDDYAEIKLWILWTRHVNRAAKNKITPLYRFDYDAKTMVVEEARMRVTTALGGRPFCDPDTRILNYSDQGTGASIAVYAIVSMEQLAKDSIISFVHDEIVLECKEADVPIAKRQLEDAMRHAGNRFLSAYSIPVDADAIVSNYWSKS